MSADEKAAQLKVLLDLTNAIEPDWTIAQVMELIARMAAEILND